MHNKKVLKGWYSRRKLKKTGSTWRNQKMIKFSNNMNPICQTRTTMTIPLGINKQTNSVYLNLSYRNIFIWLKRRMVNQNGDPYMRFYLVFTSDYMKCLLNNSFYIVKNMLIFHKIFHWKLIKRSKTCSWSKFILTRCND